MRWGPGFRRRLAALIGLVVIAVAVVPSPAGADEITDKQAQADAIAAKISPRSPVGMRFLTKSR